MAASAIAPSTGSFSLSANIGSRHVPLSSLDNDPAATFGDMDWAKEDDSFEVPNFHFDWGVAKEKTSTSTTSHIGRRPSTRDQSSVMGKVARVPEGNVTNLPAISHTPPSTLWTSGPSSAGSSQHRDRSSSSDHKSSSSYDSPAELAAMARLRSSSHVANESSDSGGSGTGGRMYGARTFQRVVSAPLTRSHLDNSLQNHGSTSGFSATIRPQLMHTLSNSSADDAQRQKTPRPACVTPGLTDKVYAAGSTSTARRLIGLSRFGGPARRVAPPHNEDGELREDSPSLILSPPPSRASPSVPDSATQNDEPDLMSPLQTNPPESQLRVASTIEADERYSVDSYRYAHDRRQAAASSPPRIAARYEQSHFGTAHLTGMGQENQPIFTSQDYRDKSLQSASIRPAPQPLRPAHAIATSASPPEINRQRQDQSQFQQPKGAVEPRIPYPEQRAFTDQAPQRAAPAPPAAQPGFHNGKRSYVVNGAPYERVGVLGKGGSSKVYSVICPAKRVIYALKRVTLERADAETYQSYTNEIELLKRLRGHDRVIQLIDHQITFGQGNRPKVLMMVMECGEIDFAMLLEEQRGKPLNLNFVGLYWEQMLQAVQAVHQENVVHTDLKPANFVLVKGRLKIIDFGIAKAVANDTVNIQRDQQIGTVNYMSPEAIQRMNNQKVLKLSYPSDIWSMGCILYQMIYGNPPFAHIPGGPLPKMNAIADPKYVISFPAEAVPKAILGSQGLIADGTSLAVRVGPAAVDTMRRCLAYRKEYRLTIPELLQHEFLHPRSDNVSSPPGTTSITPDQMAMLVNFVVRQNGLPPLPSSDTTATDLFEQLMEQNSHIS